MEYFVPRRERGGEESVNALLRLLVVTCVTASVACVTSARAHPGASFPWIESVLFVVTCFLVGLANTAMNVVIYVGQMMLRSHVLDRFGNDRYRDSLLSPMGVESYPDAPFLEKLTRAEVERWCLMYAMSLIWCAFIVFVVAPHGAFWTVLLLAAYAALVGLLGSPFVLLAVMVFAPSSCRMPVFDHLRPGAIRELRLLSFAVVAAVVVLLAPAVVLLARSM